MKLFGTDGIRGEAGKFPLDPPTVRTIGESLTRHLAEVNGGRTPQIVTGRDTRESGAWIERALISGAQCAGASVQSAGIITTPGVAFLARNLAADAGVVISASHNPYQDNGIKIFDRSGRKLPDMIERRIEADISESAHAWSDSSEDPVDLEELHSAALRSRYLEYLLEDVAGKLSLADFSLVVDCANGASFELAPELLKRLGARVVSLNDEPDGRNINLNCGSLHIEGLQRRVVAEHADLGVAYDGDADRALFVDAHGSFVDGDATLWVMADQMKAAGELDGDTVIATVMSNIGLEIALRSRNITLIRTDVGDKYVLEELLRTGAVLGGEQSGHIIFPRISLAGDGMITTICLLRLMATQHHPLHELTQDFRRYPQILINVPVREKIPFSLVSPVQSLADEIKEKLGNNGRLLLRYSGTEPLARVMIEGADEDDVKAKANELADVIRAELGDRKN